VLIASAQDTCTQSRLADSGIIGAARRSPCDAAENLVVKPSYQAGDVVIWLKRQPGGFVFPHRAKVLAATAKRVTIEVDDPDEDGSGLVIRHVPPDSLQPHQETGSRSTPKRSIVNRAVKKRGR
jgi:hypothetical protein